VFGNIILLLDFTQRNFLSVDHLLGGSGNVFTGLLILRRKNQSIKEKGKVK
jgi:hypothetical protein